MRRRSFLPLAVFAALLAAASARAQDATPGESELPAVIEDSEATAPSPPAAVELETIHSFGGEGGRGPRGGLAADKEGNLYGTASAGGLCDDCGLVYMLSPPQDGGTRWEYRVLHLFEGGEADGRAPVGALTIRGNAIYGTTSAGGDPACDCGAVFRLKPIDRARTKWDYSILHRLRGGNAGAAPLAGVVFGEDGALYGATSAGGADGAGTIFRLKGGGEGGWRPTILHHFRTSRDGSAPQGEFVFGEKLTLFGTTSGGGRFGQGTVFRLTRNGSFAVIHHFKGVRQTGGAKDGAGPEGHLAFGQDGALYGTTASGGDSDRGVVFRIRPSGESRWVYSVIHHFKGGADDGRTPRSGLTMDGAGSLYGTAPGGGPHDGGLVYRLARIPGEGWGTETLHAFARSGSGGGPQSRLAVRNGSLYGTTFAGGSAPRSEGCPDGCGSVYQLER